MRLGSIPLIVLLVAAIFSAGATAEAMVLPASPAENTPPCHRHSQPPHMPASHPCCQSGQASAMVKSVREEVPSSAPVLLRNISEKLDAGRIFQNVRPDQLRSGTPPGRTQLRI
jgi:hypothetical protein